MTYCLMTEDKKLRVEIRCSMANKPETVSDLCVALHKNDVELISPTKIPKVVLNAISKKDARELITDWEATGTGLRQINWIATEDL